MAASALHGSNDGQKGMGLILLVLIGFCPLHYALTVNNPEYAPQVRAAVGELREAYAKAGVPIPKRNNPTEPMQLGDHLDMIETELKGLASFDDYRATRRRGGPCGSDHGRDAGTEKNRGRREPPRGVPRHAGPSAEGETPASYRICAAMGDDRHGAGVGIGTTVGYKRIVKTVAEKIGKQHLTYAQGAAAQAVAGVTILLAALTGLPVSTTHVLSSGVAGTMVANRSGLQLQMIVKIFSAWIFTLPSCILLAGLLFTLGRLIVG